MDKNLLEARLLTSLTLMSTFLMGFIDAYIFLKYDGLLVSAQTGNIVLMGANYNGHILSILPNITSFIGFLGGAFVAQGFIENTKNIGFNKYQLYLLVQILVFFIASIFNNIIDIFTISIMLGFIGGYNMTLFNQVDKARMNNGVMTNNIKMIMNHLYKMIFYKDNIATTEFLSISMGLLIFVTGVFSSITMYPLFEKDYMMFVPLSLSVITLVYVEFVKKKHKI